MVWKNPDRHTHAQHTHTMHIHHTEVVIIMSTSLQVGSTKNSPELQIRR